MERNFGDLICQRDNGVQLGRKLLEIGIFIFMFFSHLQNEKFEDILG
jgi:hypothetical protein